MPLDVHTTEPLAHALNGAECDGLVLQPTVDSDDWTDTLASLQAVFRLSQAAAREERPVVYIVDNDDLLGRNGPGRAMVATGVLSAARTLAVEMAKMGVPVNVIGLDPETDPATAARWILAALDGGPTGEFIRMGPGHVGKALP